MSVLCIPVSLPGLARHTVLLTEHAPKHARPERASRAEGSFPTASFPRPDHPTPSLFCQQSACLTPLPATLMGHLASVAIKRLTPPAKSFRCNTYKKHGGGLVIMVNHLLETSHPSLGAALKFFALTLLRTLLHSFALFCAQRKLNPLIFKRFRTLSQKHRGAGGYFRSVNGVYPALSGCSLRSLC